MAGLALLKGTGPGDGATRIQLTSKMTDAIFLQMTRDRTSFDNNSNPDDLIKAYKAIRFELHEARTIVGGARQLIFPLSESARLWRKIFQGQQIWDGEDQRFTM